MDEDNTFEVDDHLEPESIGDEDESGFPWAGLFLVVWALALIIFSVQNAEEVTVEFLGWDLVMPIAVLVVVTALLTMTIAWIARRVISSRRSEPEL